MIQQILAWAHLWRPSPPMNLLLQAFLFLFFSFLPFFLSVCVSLLIPHQFLLRNDVLAHGRRILSPYFKLPQNLTSSRKRISLCIPTKGVSVQFKQPRSKHPTAKPHTTQSVPNWRSTKREAAVWQTQYSKACTDDVANLANFIAREHDR